MNDTDAELLQAHLAKVTNSLLYSNNGALYFSYQGACKGEIGYYCPQKMNIGDYVQVLAARQFFSKIDTFVDRDTLGEYNGPKVNMIMNSWYNIWEKNKVFSPNINPLLVAIHISNREEVGEDTIAYFKAHEPIGCRDYETRDFLLAQGVSAYFSGCMTLTLGRTYSVAESERTNDVYFVDYRLGKDDGVDARLDKYLKAYADCSFHYLSHDYPKSDDIEGCFNEVEYLLRLYSKARLVVTRKIHCALPCLAMGTPVILVITDFDARRFRGIIDLLNWMGYDQSRNYYDKVQVDNNGKVVNPTAFKLYRDNLIKLCCAFTKTENSGFNGLNSDRYFREHQLVSDDYQVRKVPRFLFSKSRKGDFRQLTFLGFIHIGYARKKSGDKLLNFKLRFGRAFSSRA